MSNCVHCVALRESHTSKVLAVSLGYEPAEIDEFIQEIHVANEHDSRPVERDKASVGAG